MKTLTDDDNSSFFNAHLSWDTNHYKAQTQLARLIMNSGRHRNNSERDHSSENKTKKSIKDYLRLFVKKSLFRFAFNANLQSLKIRGLLQIVSFLLNFFFHLNFFINTRKNNWKNNVKIYCGWDAFSNL